MNIIINGQPKSFTAPLNLYDVLAQEEVIGMMIAVARNGTFVPKDDYAHIALEDGDDIEIVAPMQGG
ncbi:MAG: sulfur carrier protein ThiS [Rhodospirillales bacterium]|nr:sulfur carrier protein ThiS [Alphaproteobacteria bacterium]MCB9981759.1 sulfur carrier protein ThiS [Rhodospirillales bacterium]